MSNAAPPKQSGADSKAFCYLHIGAPKTGSTFLQQVFYENRFRLREFGLLYPDVSLRGYAHHDLAFLLSGGYPEWATKQDRALESLVHDLGTAVAGHHGSILLSSENFYLFPKVADLKRVLEITGALSGREPRIVVYLRPQDEAHESWYNQRVKAQGETGTIEESVEQFDRLWDYEYQLGLWAAEFGDETLIVRGYPPPEGSGSPLLDDMLRVLKIDGFAPLVPQQPVNVRENRDILSFQQILNRLPLPPEQKRRFHRELMQLSELSKGLGLFNEQPLLASDRRRAIMDRYAAANEAVAKRYLSNHPLFEARQPPDPVAAEASTVEPGMTIEKMLYILGWLLAKKE